MFEHRAYRKKRKMAFLIVLICFLSSSFFVQDLFQDINIQDAEIEDFTFDNDILKELKTSSYPQAFGNSGEDINVALHQSYVNNSFNIIVNTSIVNGNNFTLPCPTDTSFNSSFTNITIENIYAPNKTIIYEDDIGGSQNVYTNKRAASFTIEGTGYLENVSVYLSNDFDPFNASLTLEVWKSKWQNSRYTPDTKYIDVLTGYKIYNFSGWLKFTNLHEKLDVLDTQNYTFFIALKDVADDTEWWLDYDNPAHPLSQDDSDDIESYHETIPGNWVYTQISTPLSTVDLTLECGFSPLNSTPSPEQVGLKINNIAANGYGDGINYGYWETNETYSNQNGKLNFNVSADWWDVECNITQAQINYTKTNLKANSNFQISASGQEVVWNVTRNGGFNYFGTDFSNYRINFTIPATWHDSSIKVFNGSDEWSINKRLLGNGYREVEVPNAINGTFWFLNATSDNLINFIDTYVDGVSVDDIVNYTNVVRFNTTFSEIVKNGNLNLSVYSPTPYYLNHTSILDLSILTPNLEFNVSDWNISNIEIQYGVFATRMAWSNGTAAGFLIGNLTILGETELTFINLPPLTFDASDVFNITAFFNDTGYIGTPPKNISDGIISYSINSNSYRTDNINILGDGLYNITIDCNDTEFNSNGPNSITINASKQYYNNQSKTIDIVILGETSLTIIRPSNGATFDSSNTFNITVKYNNTIRNEIINSPNINYSLDGGNIYRWDNIKSIGDNKYNITVNCYDTDFGNYGSVNIIVNASRSYYYNQSESFSITITGDTALTLTKWPDKSFYYSDEDFIITANFNDTSRNQGIDSATIDVDVDGTTYNSPSLVYVGNGNYNITIDCSDAIFSSYGAFNVRVNASKLNYYTKSDSSLDPIVIGNTSLIILSPSDGSIYTTAQIFNIIIQYEDVVQSTGISGATIMYSLNEGAIYRGDNVTYIGSGRYNITVYASHSDFNKFGFLDLIINASKQNYNNLSVSLNIHRQITTIITPSNSIDLGSVMRGLNISYVFDYSDTTGSPINEASWERISPSYNFITFLANNGDGNYTMHFNTSDVDVSGSPYTFMFNISSIGNETQVLSITIDVTIIQTNIEDISWTSVIARHSGLNQSIMFYFNDTTNTQPVLDVTTGDVIVRNFDTGIPWDTGDFNWNLNNPWNNGTYILDVSTNGLNAGWYTLELDVSKTPNYDQSITYISFYLRGNYTYFNLLSISDLGGALTSIGPGYHYRIFEGSNITLEYSLIDLEFYNNTVLEPASSYIVRYKNLNTEVSGILQSNIQYDYPNHVGDIITSNSELVAGNYLINISTAILNYENATFYFNITIIEKHGVRITVIDQPTEVTAGGFFNITLKAEYYDGSVWLPLLGVDMTITTYFDGIVRDEFDPIYTNSSGIYVFRVTTIEAMNITLIAEIQEEYNHLGKTLPILNIKLNPIPPGLTFEAFIPYLIIIGAAIAVAGGSIGVYRGVVVPKKREKSRVLKEVKTIFDDAISLEHILVLYKGTGTCIYFKSFGSEDIDPELISGFISAICSFGKDLVCQEELNEITYGDKMLLLSDGEFIRVALVLSKKASIILSKNLMDFINGFEKSYASELPNWRGQLNVFRNAGRLVDEILSTSIILPHEITYEFSNIKALKNPHSKDVLKVANTLLKDSDRSFFFIATLLKEATEKTHKDTAEIFMGIKELRDKKILIPIEIGAIEAQPISQQELALINQKVAGLVNLSQEERQKLVNDLAQVGPAEREAYFASLMEQHEIVSAPIEEKPGATLIDNVKGAKKEINRLKKIAKTARKEKDYGKTSNIYQNAVKIASSWELAGELEQLNEFIRSTKIEDLRIKMKTLEKEAKLAAKEEKYNEAAQKYKMSSKIASEIFKLGGTEMTKEVKRLSNKSKEYEKLI